MVAASAMTIAVRQASLSLNPSFIVFLRFALTLGLLVLVIVLFAKFRKSLQFTRPGLHLLRGAFFVVSAQLGFYSIAHIELVTVTVLFFTAPLFAAILSVVFQGEKIGPRRIAAMLVGFLGVIVVLRPDTGSLDWAMMAALASSLLFASALVVSKSLVAADGANSALVSSTALTAIASVPIIIPVADFAAVPASAIVIIVLALAGGVRVFADIKAYSLGEASVLAPITYTRLVLIGVAAYVLFGEIPDATALIGAAIIVGAALYIAHRENQARKAKSARSPE